MRAEVLCVCLGVSECVIKYENGIFGTPILHVTKMMATLKTLCSCFHGEAMEENVFLTYHH